MGIFGWKVEGNKKFKPSVSSLASCSLFLAGTGLGGACRSHPTCARLCPFLFPMLSGEIGWTPGAFGQVGAGMGDAVVKLCL